MNFQTMICDLSGMEVANASLLDEGSAAAEAMTLCERILSRKHKGKTKFFVSSSVHQPTIEVLKTRAEPLGIELVLGDHQNVELDESFLGALVQYPGTDGEVCSYKEFADAVHQQNGLLVCAADLLSLALLASPGSWGADVVVGNSQRFGVPLGFGGPHAAFMAVRDEFRRELPDE